MGRKLWRSPSPAPLLEQVCRIRWEAKKSHCKGELWMALRTVVWHPLPFHTYVHTHSNPNEKQFLQNSTIWGRITPRQHQQNEKFSMFHCIVYSERNEKTGPSFYGAMQKTEGKLKACSEASLATNASRCQRISLDTSAHSRRRGLTTSVHAN